MTQTLSHNSTKRVIYALMADVVLVIVFAAIGRDSHHEAVNLGGIASTAWTFLTGLLLGWIVTRNWRRPLQIWPNAVCVWLITVAGGMALRILSGETAALAFVIVATLFLGVVLLGHRVLANAVLRAKNRG